MTIDQAAQYLIEESIDYTICVHAEYTPEIFAAMEDKCEDYGDTNVGFVFWGGRDGGAWKVALDRRDS